MTSALVLLGLILMKIEPVHESLFFVGVITLLLVYMILLIKDLDDPFGFSEKGSTQDVSLCPVTEVAERLRRRCIDVTTGSAAPAAAEHRGDPADDCA